MEIRPVGDELFHMEVRQVGRQTERQSDRQTDMTKLMVTWKGYVVTLKVLLYIP